LTVQPMTIYELCEHLDISRDTFFKWIEKKGLLPYRLGHDLKSKNEDDDERLKKRAL